MTDQQKIFYISVVTEKMIEALERTLIDEVENGYWGINLEPAYMQLKGVGLTPEKPKRVHPKWYQGGASYFPGSEKILKLCIEAFFNVDNLDSILFDPIDFEEETELDTAYEVFEEIAYCSRLTKIEVDEYTVFVNWEEF